MHLGLAWPVCQILKVSVAPEPKSLPTPPLYSPQGGKNAPIFNITNLITLLNSCHCDDAWREYATPAANKGWTGNPHCWASQSLLFKPTWHPSSLAFPSPVRYHQSIGLKVPNISAITIHVKLVAIHSTFLACTFLLWPWECLKII